MAFLVWTTFLLVRLTAPDCSLWPGAAIIKGGKHPGVFAAACLNFIKYLTTVGRP